MSKMGPQVERRFERRESRNVIVVKSTAQPSEIINILYDVRVSMHLISTLVVQDRGKNSQWNPTEK